MSLIDLEFEKSYIMEKTSAENTYGGVDNSYKRGAEILVAYALDSSTAARIAEQDGVVNRYKLFTRRSVTLKAPDVIERASDGKYFQVTSDGSDNRTPKGAGLDLRVVEAKQWEIPADEQAASV